MNRYVKVRHDAEIGGVVITMQCACGIGELLVVPYAEYERLRAELVAPTIEQEALRRMSELRGWKIEPPRCSRCTFLVDTFATGV